MRFPEMLKSARLALSALCYTNSGYSISDGWSEALYQDFITQLLAAIPDHRPKKLFSGNSFTVNVKCCASRTSLDWLKNKDLWYPYLEIDLSRAGIPDLKVTNVEITDVVRICLQRR